VLVLNCTATGAASMVMDSPDAAHFEHGVHGHVAAALAPEYSFERTYGTRAFHCDGVLSGQHEVEQILASASRVLDVLHAGVIVTQGDLGADDDRLGCVLYDSLNFALVS